VLTKQYGMIFLDALPDAKRFIDGVESSGRTGDVSRRVIASSDD
jgi:hypothetical protein